MANGEAASAAPQDSRMASWAETDKRRNPAVAMRRMGVEAHKREGIWRERAHKRERERRWKETVIV